MHGIGARGGSVDGDRGQPTIHVDRVGTGPGDRDVGGGRGGAVDQGQRVVLISAQRDGVPRPAADLIVSATRGVDVNRRVITSGNLVRAGGGGIDRDRGAIAAADLILAVRTSGSGHRNV